MDPSRPGGAFDGRRTVPGQVPTSWKRPRRGTVVWLALVTLAYGGFLLLSTPEQGILDARLWYGPQDITELLTSQGEEGRRAYTASALADLGFIVVYSALLVTWIRFLRVRRALPRKLPAVMGLLPAVFDLMETGSILMLLRHYPEQPTHFVWLAVVGTPLKWLTLLGIGALILFGRLRLAFGRR